MSIANKISEFNTTIINLRTLADYIEQEVPQEYIDMENFWNFKKSPLEVTPTSACGASACALGWSATCKDPNLRVKPSDFWSSEIDGDDYSCVCEGQVRWFRYSKRVYPALGYPLYSENWDEVFGCDLSSRKVEVVNRLRRKAEELEDVKHTYETLT